MSERLTDAELDAIEARHQPRGVDGDEDTAYEWGVWHDVERLVSEVRRLRDVLHIVAGFRPETEIERVLVQHAQDALHGDGDA